LPATPTRDPRAVSWDSTSFGPLESDSESLSRIPHPKVELSARGVMLLILGGEI